MNRFFAALLAGCLCLCISGCRGAKNSSAEDDRPIEAIPEYDPMSVLPISVDKETEAKIYEVTTPEPIYRNGETVYPLYYGSAVALTKDEAEWKTWLSDPSLAPLPQLRDDRSFVLTWCHQFAGYEPEEVGLVLMNYFEYDLAYTGESNAIPASQYPSNPWGFSGNKLRFFNWAGLRRCIQDRRVVCAGYAQLFYLIVREKYPDVKYMSGAVIGGRHARNLLDGDFWDLTWLDDAGVDYNPDKIKFDFVGMQKRIRDNVGHDWVIINLVEGQAPW